jgi:hypothetical protein
MKRILILFFIVFSGCSKSQSLFFNLSQHGVVGANQYYAAQQGDVTFTDDDFQYSIGGYAKTGFTARSTAGYVEFKTTEVNISVKVGGNWSTASSSFDVQSDCEVLVDGVYNQSVRLTADNTTQTYSITLPAGPKLVRLVNGYTANALSGSITLPDAGVYVQGIITDTDFQVKKPVLPRNKWLVIGNSIETGATGTHPSITGFVGLLRNDGRNIISDCFGGRRLLTVSASDGHNLAAFLSAEMNGTVSNELFMFLSTNNFAVGGGQSKALFKSEYQNFLDSLHSIRPDIIVYCISMFNRNIYATPNSQGATGDDYADAISELCATRSAWAKYIYGKNLLTLANTSDGLHPNQTGMQEVHDKFLIQYNLVR